MTNTEKCLAKGCYFPEWVNSEKMIELVTTNEGPELHAAFGYADATNSSKFLSKFFPGKPKSVRFNNYVKELIL